MKSLWFAVLLLIAVAATIAIWQVSSSSDAELPPGVSRERYDAAAVQFMSVSGRRPDHLDVLSWLAESFVAQDELERAAACFEHIPSTHPEYGHGARYQQGQVLLRLNRAAEAEAQLEEFLRLEADSPQMEPRHVEGARRRLRSLLETQLRYEERHELLRAMYEDGQFDVYDAVFFCFPNLLRWNGEAAIGRLEAFYEEAPEDFDLRVSLARYRTGQGRLEEAASLLEACRRERPADLRAAAAQLALLRERGEWDAMAAILEELPPASDADPWLLLRLRGHYANYDEQYEQAIACFERALASDPANAESYTGLATAYAGLDRRQERQEALRRVNVLARIQNRLGWALNPEPGQPRPLVEIAELCLEIDLVEQARIMAEFARQADPDDERVRQLLSRLAAEGEDVTSTHVSD